MIERIKTANNSRVLALNSAMIPIDVVPWEIAVTDTWVTNKARIVSEYSDMFVHTGYSPITGEQGVFPIPSIIQYPNAPSDKIPFVRMLQPTPENLLRREKYKCCYCGCKINEKTATIEHVYPKSKGGLDDWMNLRMACTRCNGEKGDKLLGELGWKLKDLPIPSITADVSKSIIHKVGGRILDESWRPYIYWDIVYN